MDYSTWKHLSDNGYRPVEYIYKPDNFSNPNFGLGIIAYGNKYGLEVKMQASQEDIDYAMSGHQLQICGYFGVTRIDNLPYSNACQIYIRQNSGYYLGRQTNRGWYTKPDGTITVNSMAHPLITPCDTDIHIVSTYYDSESNVIKTFLDGVQKATDGSGSKAWENDLTAGTEYFVYGFNNSGSYSFKGRIYYIKTFDDERNVTGHFIPCVRKSDGRAGLYDVVNSVFKVSTYDYIKAGPYPGQRLPYDYKEVEYIKNNSSSGGLNTGMKMSITDYSVEAKFKTDEVRDGMMLGTSVYDAGALWFYDYYSGSHNEFAVYANYISGWKVGKILWRPLNTDIHTVKFEGHPTGCDISWDNGNTFSRTYTTPQQYSTDNLFVFGRGVSTNCYYGRIYYVKLWNTTTGAMMLDYVPCIRVSDDTPGFYDLVNNEFKTIANATTKWEAGPDIITEQIPWAVGTGNIRLTYIGVGNGTIIAESDETNLYEARSAQFTVMTTDGSNIERTITISQAAKERIDISNAVVSAANQTYSGSAKTPTPTVTLNGETIPSSGYDVEYSDNTNAGTATITVTGKGEYTGTATGIFTIAKAAPTYTAPTAITGLTYSGSSQYLVTAGSTSHGTIQYSSNGTTWSTTRPSSTNAGSYTTYWRLVGDSNHNDVASTSLSTTIAKASRTLSFADSYVVLNTSSNVTKTATPSAGSGDGAITYSISSTTYATINSSTGAVTSKTSDGSATVTATIAEGTNYLSASASYTLYVFATTHNYDYNGSYRSVTLPPGAYQFQCWGAQGGSNAAASTYGITAKAGGKGGYSVGQLTISQATGVRVYVGGQGSSSAGGYNGGGSTTGSSTKNADNEQGVSRMGGGGGATDIRLSDGNLLSRMIVAGGGAGGAMCYKKITSSSTETITDATSNSVINITDSGRGLLIMQNIPVTAGKTYTISGAPSGYNVILKPTVNADWAAGGNIYTATNITIASGYNYLHVFLWKSNIISGDNVNISKCTHSYYQANTIWGNKYQTGIGSVSGIYWKARKYNSLGVSVYKVNISTKATTLIKTFSYSSGWTEGGLVKLSFNSAVSLGSNEYIGIDAPIYYTDRLTDSSGKSFSLYGGSLGGSDNTAIGFYSYYEPTGFTAYCRHTETIETITESNDSQVGGVGGGTQGGAYSSTYAGKQNAAGTGGSFGQGAAQSVTNYRYCSGAGGGGWYGGGGGQRSDSSMTYCKYSGGGSGFVNTAASAGNRPSGYTGLQLDSGSTTAGSSSFPAPGGGNETGHAGNGYARITRLS